MTTFPTTLVLAVLAATLALTGCGNDRTSGSFNEADLRFAQMMIPHHDQAISMSDMLLEKDGVHPEVIAVAQQIKSGQQPEIDTMNRWLDAKGRVELEDDGGQHHGGGEDGTLTEEQMRQLDQANGTDGQRLYLQGMIKHHQGAIKMAETEIQAGENGETINLAKQIASSQQQEIETMRALLSKV